MNAKKVGGICCIILGMFLLGVNRYLVWSCFDCSSTIPSLNPIFGVTLYSAISFFILGICLILVSIGKLKFHT